MQSVSCWSLRDIASRGDCVVFSIGLQFMRDFHDLRRFVSGRTVDIEEFG